MLFGCIHSPDFPVQAAIRHDAPAIFNTSPVVILDGSDSALSLFGSNHLVGIYSTGIATSRSRFCFYFLCECSFDLGHLGGRVETCGAYFAGSFDLLVFRCKDVLGRDGFLVP